MGGKILIRYILRRLVLLIPVLLIVSFMVFALMDLAPGDLMSSMDLSEMSEQEIADLRSELGLDAPLPVRYARYMFRLLQGDMGVGDYSKHSVWGIYIERLPNTLVLAAFAILIGVSISIPLGIFAAKRAGRAADTITTAFTMVGMSMPIFWLAILMMLLFAFVLGWLPAAGYNEGLRSIILPAVCAAMGLLAACTRQTRSSMLEVLRADYLRTARAKGVPEKVVIRKHALGNAMIPIVTTIGMSIAMAVSGSAIVETVFAWPGIGQFVVLSVGSRDVTSTTGTVILTTTLYVLILLLVDLAYAFIDPRIRAQYVSKKAKKAVVSSAPAATEAQANAPSSETYAGKAEDTVYARADIATPDKAQAATKDDAPAVAYIDDEQDEDFVSFATVTNFEEAEVDEVVDSSESVVRKYRKRSRGGEIFRHLRRNKGAVAGMIILSILIILFIVAQFMNLSDVNKSTVSDRFAPPSAQYPFGADQLGRNLFLRVIYATRFSLPIGLGATIIASFIGVFLGSLAAFREGTIIEEVIMRFTDSLASIPGLLMGMVIITALGRSVPSLIFAIGVSATPIFVRISRASVLTVRGNEFVEASRALGLSELRVLYTKILPNGLAPIIITFTGTLGAVILISSGLSFLGFGVQAPNPEWGSLISAGRDSIRNAPWLTTFPGLFIMMTVMAFNLLGDGLRDALDPKLKR